MQPQQLYDLTNQETQEYYDRIVSGLEAEAIEGAKGWHRALFWIIPASMLAGAACMALGVIWGSLT